MSTSITALLKCGDCSRHFRDREPRCPFCGASRSIAVARPLPAPLSAGASRSRRRAAALVAGGAMVACGGDLTSTAKIGDKGGAAGFGEGGSAAQSSGGATSGGQLVVAAGGASAGGAGTGGTNGGGSGAFAGGGGVQAGGAFGTGGVAGGRTCPGATNPLGTLCRTSQECVAAATGGYSGFWDCYMSPPLGPCRGFVPPQQCLSNADCRDGAVCQPLNCGGAICVPGCGATCTGVNECVNGVCTAKRCDVAGAAPCDPGSTCNPTDPNASTPGCVGAHCTSGAGCNAGWDCSPTAPNDGCVHRPCTVDSDCVCGYCVNSYCEPTLGACYQIIATPYGCVWPDEELV